MWLNLLYEDLNVESFAYDGNARSNLNVGTKAFLSFFVHSLQSTLNLITIFLSLFKASVAAKYADNYSLPPLRLNQRRNLFLHLKLHFRALRFRGLPSLVSGSTPANTTVQ